MSASVDVAAVRAELRAALEMHLRLGHDPREDQEMVRLAFQLGTRLAAVDRADEALWPTLEASRVMDDALALVATLAAIEPQPTWPG